MGISSFQDLRQWFFAGIKQKGEEREEAAPHWNLYAGDYGAREVRIMFNNRISDMDESFKFLETSIRAQNNPDGTRFRVQTYAPGKANNPTNETYVQIYEKSASQHQQQQPAFVAGLPAGVGNVESYISERLRTERLQWELDALKDQINAPSEKWERILDTVAGIQGIDKVLQTVIVGLVSKFVPNAMPDVMRAINGTPQAQSAGDHEHDEDGHQDETPEQAFQNNIYSASQTLGIDPVTLAKKLNKLVQENPEMAKSLMQ